MKNDVNIRLKDWYKSMKKSKILSTQKELGKKIKNSDGNPMSQAFLSAMMNGEATVSQHTIDSISEIYFFTSPHYFVTGEDAMVDLRKLMQWILKQHNKTQKWLVKQLDDPEITEPILSQMDNNSDKVKWGKVFDRLNKLGYSVHPVYLTSQHAGEPKEFEGKSPQVKKLFEIIDFMQHKGKISSKQDFCEQVSAHAVDGRGAISNQTLSNMASQRYKQDVTKDMTVAILKAFPEISGDWFLLDIGEMLRNPASAFAIAHDMKNDILKGVKEILEKNKLKPEENDI